MGIAPRIRPNLEEAREAELRVLGFDFALSLIDSSTSQEAQQRCGAHPAQGEDSTGAKAILKGQV